MGSATSGPPRTRALAYSFNECLCVPLHDLDRAGLLDVPGRVLTVAGSPAGNVGPGVYGTIESEGIPISTLRLVYSLDDEISGQPTVQHVGVTSTPMPSGGRRPWLVCPRCRSRIRIVAMAPGGRSFGCRHCLGLVAPCRQQPGLFRREY